MNFGLCLPRRNEMKYFCRCKTIFTAGFILYSRHGDTSMNKCEVSDKVSLVCKACICVSYCNRLQIDENSRTLGPPFFLIILFLSTTLLTKMTGISLHMPWPPSSKSHFSFLKENNCFFCYGSNSTPLSN
jgi:hypothetical protein